MLMVEAMGDHVVLNVDSLRKLGSIKSSESFGSTNHLGEDSCSMPLFSSFIEGEGEKAIAEEDEILIQSVECRICQDEDHIKNLETPCGCNGSLKYAHRACVQRWCDEKGDVTCEICHEVYRPGYVVVPRVNSDDTIIDLSGGWSLTGSRLDLHDPRFITIETAPHHFLEAEYDDYTDANASGAAFCRSVALILLGLLLLRHAMTITNNDGDDDALTIFSLFLLRAAGFLFPCYIMAWALSIIQRRRQRQEAAALAATEVAFILQSGHREGLHFTIASESPTTPQHEPLQQ